MNKQADTIRALLDYRNSAARGEDEAWGIIATLRWKLRSLDPFLPEVGDGLPWSILEREWEQERNGQRDEEKASRERHVLSDSSWKHGAYVFWRTSKHGEWQVVGELTDQEATVLAWKMRKDWEHGAWGYVSDGQDAA